MEVTVKVDVTNCKNCPFARSHQGHGECWTECAHKDHGRDAAEPIKLIFEPAPRNELEALQHGNALANEGNYPVGTSECFNVGIAGGCGPDCFVYRKGECGEPQEMLPRLDCEGLRLHAELYGPSA